MANPYRALFAMPGAKVFISAGFVGRMPMSMNGIAIVLLVSSVTGSYAIAGAVSATNAIGFAVISPVVGRLTDRLGQHRILVPIAIGNAISVITLIVLTQTAPTWTFFPAALAGGLTSPSLSALVRARWSYLLSRPGTPDLHTAFSMESVADEVIFITGPILVTVLATTVHPAAGVALSGLLALVGCFVLATQRATEPPARPREPGAGSAGSALASRGLPVLVGVFLIMGSVFAATEVSVIAFAQEHGHRPLSGGILAVFAFGSMSAGLWYGARTWRAGADRRFMVGITVMAAGLALLLLANSLVLMTILIFFAGLAISPTIIPGYGLVEGVVPGRLLTEGLTWVSTAVGVGVSIGAPVAGHLIDAYGARTALLYPVGAAWLAAAIAITGLRRLRTRGLPPTEAT
jgi:MFS family permease